MESGWDPGWHAYDLYTFQRRMRRRFYHTTKPYTELGYVLASHGGAGRSMSLHTQNIRPNWNFAFEYRLINAPGTFMNQNTNHNNYPAHLLVPVEEQTLSELLCAGGQQAERLGERRHTESSRPGFHAITATRRPYRCSSGRISRPSAGNPFVVNHHHRYEVFDRHLSFAAAI